MCVSGDSLFLFFCIAHCLGVGFTFITCFIWKCWARNSSLYLHVLNRACSLCLQVWYEQTVNSPATFHLPAPTCQIASLQILAGYYKLPCFYFCKSEELQRLTECVFSCNNCSCVAWGSVVVKVLRYYSEGPGIDSWWCHWIFQWHISFWPFHGPGVDSAPSEN